MFECTNSHAPIQKIQMLIACLVFSNQVEKIQEMGQRRIKINKCLVAATRGSVGKAE